MAADHLRRNEEKAHQSTAEFVTQVQSDSNLGVELIIKGKEVNRGGQINLSVQQPFRRQNPGKSNGGGGNGIQLVENVAPVVLRVEHVPWSKIE
jgi:hypothetical protein